MPMRRSISLIALLLLQFLFFATPANAQAIVAGGDSKAAARIDRYEAAVLDTATGRLSLVLKSYY